MDALPSDPEARFHAVIAAWGPALSRVCRGHEADPARREELRQDVLVALWRALPGFRGDASPRTFVFRVAHNTALNHRRRGARDRSEPGLPDGLADDRTDPVVALDRHGRRARLERAVQALPDVDREVVMLHLEGLSHSEIGEVTGLSPSNVGTRLSRARARLRAVVEVDDGR